MSVLKKIPMYLLLVIFITKKRVVEQVAYEKTQVEWKKHPHGIFVIFSSNQIAN